MRKFGLKLWSTNTDYYYEEAKRLYAEGMGYYIELYIVPDTTETIEKWKILKEEYGIPFNLHAPHFMHGVNLAKREKKDSNLRIYKQVKEFADTLKVDYIVFHGGIDGDIKETVEQLRSFEEPRAILENKPFKAIPNKMGGIFCRGAIFDEIKYVLDEVKCGFCLDIGHAICSANSQGIDKWRFIEQLKQFDPSVYHLTDLRDINSEYDSHAHIGQGFMDIEKALSFIEVDKCLTIETEKNFKDNLKDFEGDVICLKDCF
jgi:endonuclease IV